MPNKGRARKKQKTIDNQAMEDDTMSCSSRMSCDDMVDSKAKGKLAFPSGVHLSLKPGGMGTDTASLTSDLARYEGVGRGLGGAWL